MTYKNTFERGVTTAEALGVVPLTRGIPAEERGIPKTTGEALHDQEIYGGIPMNMPSSTPKDDGRCKATTKKGAPCKGYRTKDSDFCVGHGR